MSNLWIRDSLATVQTNTTAGYVKQSEYRLGSCTVDCLTHFLSVSFICIIALWICQGCSSSRLAYWVSNEHIEKRKFRQRAQGWNKGGNFCRSFDCNWFRCSDYHPKAKRRWISWSKLGYRSIRDAADWCGWRCLARVCQILDFPPQWIRLWESHISRFRRHGGRSGASKDSFLWKRK